MKKFRRTKSDVLTNATPPAEKKPRKIWAIVIILVMAMSVVGFLSFDYSSIEKYNGFKLVNVDARSWKVVKIPDLLFYSHPNELESFPLTEDFMLRLKASPVIWFTTPPDDANNETISAVIFDFVWPFAEHDSIVRRGITTSNGSLPFVTCANATSSLPIVVVETGSNRSLERTGTCYTFTGQTTRDFVDLRDRILYGFYNVIPDSAGVAGGSP